MKLFRNPFFYLTLLLFVILVFQVVNFVNAAWVEPSQNFPNGSPAAPLDTSDLTQSKLGVSFTAGTPPRLIFDPLVSIYGVNGTTPQPAYIPRDSVGSSIMYFDGEGFFIKKIGSTEDFFVVKDNGNVHMSGNVGIGFSDPGAKLQVCANGACSAGDTVLLGNDLFLADIDTANTIRLRGGSDRSRAGFQFGDNGPTIQNVGNSFHLSGNLGIGVSPPAARLHVSGAIGVNVTTKDPADFPTDFNTGQKIPPTLKKYLPIIVNGTTYFLALYEAANFLVNPLVNNQHTEFQCISMGGEIMTSGGNTFCKFISASCPSGWGQYQSFSKTVSDSCDGDFFRCSGGTSCTTGSHSNFSNTAREACSYEEEVSDNDPGGACDLSPSNCFATVTEVGCY